MDEFYTKRVHMSYEPKRAPVSRENMVSTEPKAVPESRAIMREAGLH